MLTRTIPPQIILPNSIDVPQANEQSLANGGKLLWINSGNDPVCRLDIILNAGSRYQTQSLEATATFSMLSEGTKAHTSQQISEHFDFHGSFIDLTADRDWGKITLYSLKKYFAQSIEMLAEIIMTPSFPAKELHTWSSRNKQNLIVELDKTSTLVRQAFFQSLFGEHHPYGRFANPSDYDKLESEQLHSFHERYFGGANSSIVLSGQIDDVEISLVEKFFGNRKWGSDISIQHNELVPSSPKFGSIFVKKADAVQTSIRIGCELFKRDHPDYPKMLILNTILGGFFGSRLMKNLREEKGYTYGVGSHIVTLRDTGFLVISTEVGTKFTQSTIDEIFKEINQLRNNPVDEQELLQVKSYMWGEALRSFNGPFAIADNIISLLQFNQLDYYFYNSLFETLNSVTPADIQTIAKKWLTAEKMVIASAGSVEPKDRK